MTDPAPTDMECRVCGRRVATGRFCDTCGAEQVRHGPDWLRIGHHCAAPSQSVLRPALISTLFPYLAATYRRVFAVAFAGLLVTLAVLVALRWQAAAVGVSVLGFPVLLVTSLVTSGVLRAMQRWTWVLAAALGTALGVGWAFVAGAWFARSYGIGFGAGVAGGPNSASLGVPLGAVLLMVMPAVVVRLVRRVGNTGTKADDGFVVGVVGATAFGLAATLVRLVPQLATGLTAKQRPIEGLLVEAGIRGIVIPMTSAAIGGITGVALWFTRGRNDSGRRRALFVAVAVAGVAVVVGTALADTTGLGPIDELLMHFLVTMVTLAVLRVTVHLALLHEAHDAPEPVAARCPECGTFTIEAAFCPSCGVARIARRPAVNDSRAWRVLMPVGGGLAAAAVCACVVSLLITEPVARYACPPECGSPPTGTAVEIQPRFTAADGAFSVSYPSKESPFDTSFGPSGVEAVLTGGDGGMLRLFGEPARGRSSEQVVHDFLARVRPNAKRAYVIPNAMVGYREGFGQVDDEYPLSPTGEYIRLRLVTMAAIKDDYALVAAAIGPFHQFGPDFGPGPPSAVNLQLALQMDGYVNSFRWRGDPGA